MSTTLRQTLIGTYEFYPQLFESLELPAEIDKQSFIDSLLLEHGEKGVIYSNPIFLEDAIGMWGRKHRHDIERIYLTLTEEYNPLHNFDRNEEYTDTNTGGKSTQHDYVTSGNNNETYTRTSDDVLEHERLSDTETENKTSAFNSDSYQPDSKTVESGNEWKDTRSGGNFTDNRSMSGRDAGTESVKENGKTVHTGHLYGNIGVTESTTMGIHEIQFRMQYNLFEILGRMFATEFLINIY